MERYIAAEKLKHILNNSKYYGKKQGNDFADMITECEAEDVAPVKHGHWENEYFDSEIDNFFHTCSCCHRETIDYGDKNFCPVCGAKMDEKDTD